MPECLFLPDNVMAVLYEEQRLIQSILDFPFRTCIPFFKTAKRFRELVILPPILLNDLIIRQCAGTDKGEGFVLGNACGRGRDIMLHLDVLKQQSGLNVFETIKCKSWYYAETEITTDEKTGLCSWIIKNKKWQKCEC